MPTFQVRDLPDHIYEALKKSAKAERRSLSQQAIILLAKGLDLEVDYQKKRKAFASLLEEEAAKYGKNEEQEVADWVRKDRDSR